MYDQCIGCGFCCLKTPCDAARRVYGPGVRLCPALEWNGERHVCTLMELPGGLGEGFREELYAGAGCCCNLNTWRKEPLQDRRPHEEPDRLPVSEIDPLFQVFLACLGREMFSGDSLSLVLSGFEGELVRSGRSREEAARLRRQAAHYLRGERTRWTDGFMGEMPGN